MIRIWRYCSNVDIDAIKTIVGDENVEVGCIGQCGQEFVAYINDELIETSTEEELFDYIKRVCLFILNLIFNFLHN